jgi:hypothetical protein
MSLTAAVDVSAVQTDAGTLRLVLRITNPTHRRIAILNPDMGVPSPAMNWPHSIDAYQTAMLISFGYLSISITDEAGQEPPRNEIVTSATPALRPPLELEPGDSFEVTVPIGEFYRLDPKKAYRVTVEYGDQNLKVSARASLPPGSRRDFSEGRWGG